MRSSLQKGFGLIEVLVGTAIFVLVSITIYQTYIGLSSAVRASHLKVVGTALANEQFEIARNLPYSSVGIQGGLPAGLLPASQTLVRDGTSFQVSTTVRNIDDPFDGTIGGTPNDTAPADYKLVEVEVACATCKNFPPLTFTTRVAPKNLEISSGNGALFVRVFNASGVPLQNVDVHVENNAASPAFEIDDVTNAAGELQLIDVPPGINAYEVTVTKTNYTTDRTYTPGAGGNPNPTKPHATVIAAQVTQISMVIDQKSTFEISSINDTCSTVAGIDFSLYGTRLIGASPNVLEYSQSHQTGVGGNLTLNNMIWDTYNTTFTDSDYALAGSIPLFPLPLTPGSTQSLQFIVKPKVPNGLLVTVQDAATSLPLSGVDVQIEGPSSFDSTKVTGRGFLNQTDWSSGSGQATSTDLARYFASDGNIDTGSPAGELKLEQAFGQYDSSGNLTSSSFDTGAVSNFYQLSFAPLAQPPDTGAGSVQLQIASNNDGGTWNFLGPDGTASTYYSAADTNINAAHNGHRYLRYKIFLSTASSTFTPNVSDVSFTFSSLCTPPGQVFWNGLASGSYTVTVTKAGYQTFTDTINVNSAWGEYQILLQPS